MDVKPFIDVLIHGTPIAVLAALVGVLWQTTYALLRDRIHDKQAQRELELEQQKFDHQQQQWREQLALELTMKLVDARLDEYSRIWSYVRVVAWSGMEQGTFTPEVAKDLADKVQAWRFSKGGLLAEETTRGAVYAFQRALWDYDGSVDSFHRVRQGRFVLRDAIRADIGLTGDVFQRAEERFQKVRHELDKLESELGIAKTDKQV
jgi:predicted oxidoreductase